MFVLSVFLFVPLITFAEINVFDLHASIIQSHLEERENFRVSALEYGFLNKE